MIQNQVRNNHPYQSLHLKGNWHPNFVGKKQFIQTVWTSWMFGVQVGSFVYSSCLRFKSRTKARARLKLFPSENLLQIKLKATLGKGLQEGKHAPGKELHKYTDETIKLFDYSATQETLSIWVWRSEKPCFLLKPIDKRDKVRHTGGRFAMTISIKKT